MFPTIRDVASRANVSFQLASGVLGHRSYVYASEATRKRIFEAAEELGYVPNTSARILRGGASKILGVLIDSRAPEVFYGILAEIEQAADKLGYRILSAQAHDNPEKLMTAYQSLRQNGVDGIISFVNDYPQLDCRLEPLLKNDPKIVSALNAGDNSPASVVVDIESGIAAAVQHLRERGYRKPALLLALPNRDGHLSFNCWRRLETFKTACPEGDALLLNAKTDPSDLFAQCRTAIRRKLLPGGFDSVIAQNDNLAAILMRQLLTEGIRIPDDFGLVGWDNLLIAECLPVSLTSLGCDWKNVAENVLKTLMKRMEGDRSTVKIRIPMSLIPRESTKKGGMGHERGGMR